MRACVCATPPDPVINSNWTSYVPRARRGRIRRCPSPPSVVPVAVNTTGPRARRTVSRRLPAAPRSTGARRPRTRATPSDATRRARVGSSAAPARAPSTPACSTPARRQPPARPDPRQPSPALTRRSHRRRHTRAPLAGTDGIDDARSVNPQKHTRAGLAVAEHDDQLVAARGERRVHRGAGTEPCDHTAATVTFYADHVIAIEVDERKCSARQRRERKTGIDAARSGQQRSHDTVLHPPQPSAVVNHQAAVIERDDTFVGLPRLRGKIEQRNGRARREVDALDAARRRVGHDHRRRAVDEEVADWPCQNCRLGPHPVDSETPHARRSAASS